MFFTHSVEALLFQGGDLHAKITECVTKIRLDATYHTNSIRESFFHERVKNATGMNVQLKVVTYDSLYYNAAVFLPYLTHDHPFYKAYFHNNQIHPRTTGSNMLEAVKNNNVTASIDLNKGMVGGLFSSVGADILIHRKLIEDTAFSPSEISAIILHELGHLFTYFQYLSSMTHGSLVTTVLVNDLMGISEPQQRVMKVKQAADILGIDIQDAEKIAMTNNEEAGVLFLKEYMTFSASRSGNIFYDLRNVEQLADQYAVKMGAGQDLASALTKLYQMTGHTTTGNIVRFLTEVTIETAIFAFFYFMSSPAWAFTQLLLCILGSIPGLDVYDPAKKRIEFIRRQLISNLKDAKASGNKVAINKILQQIEAVQVCESKVSDRWISVFSTWWYVIPSPYRTASQQEKAEKQLESLLYSDFNLHGAKFEMMSRSLVDVN